MPSVATRRWDTKAPSTLKRNTPGRWPIEQPHTCPPQGVHSIQRSFLDELKRLRETYISSLETVKQEEQSLEKRIADAVSRSQPINQAQITSLELESNAKNLRAMYDNFRQRYADSLQQQSFPISDARITARATLPLEKSALHVQTDFARACATVSADARAPARNT